MKKLINVTLALLLLCSAVTLVSCGKNDTNGSSKEYPEGTRQLTLNGITANIFEERWGGDGGNTTLYVTVELTKPDFNSKPRGKVYVQARTTDGEVLLAWRNGVYGQGGEFGDYWIGKECKIQFSIGLINNKKIAPNSLTISKLEIKE